MPAGILRSVHPLGSPGQLLDRERHLLVEFESGHSRTDKRINLRGAQSLSDDDILEFIDDELAATVTLVESALTPEAPWAPYPSELQIPPTLVEFPLGGNRIVHAVSGISFTPYYAWFDEDMRLTALGGGWMGMVPDGWDPAILKTLDDVQAEEDARMITELAGDLAIIASFGEMSDEEARAHKPKVVLVDSKNRIVDTGPERAGPQMPRRVDELVH